MKRQKRISLCCIMLILAILTGVFVVTADARQEQSKVVRVGFPTQAGLTELDENGNYTGYTYEYLQEIAQYTGWTYEFVEAPGEANESVGMMMDMLEKGEIDLMGGMLYSQELTELYNYSGFSYGTVETVLQVLYDDPTDIVIDSQVEQKMRFAILTSSKLRRQELEEFCKANLIEPEYVLCDTMEEQIAALRNGEADVLLNTSMNLVDGVRTIARFSPKPFYFAMSKYSDQGLMQQLNSALSSIGQADPYFSTALFEKYFVPKQNEILLSEAETAYLQRAGTLRVGVMNDRPPYQYQNQDELTGISVDFLNYISENTGLSLELVPVKGKEQLDQMLEDGQLDLLAGMTYDYHLASDFDVSMSRPYITSQYVLLINESADEDGMENQSLAMVNDGIVIGRTSDNIRYYDTIRECIRAVDSGAAGYTYVDASTGQYYLNHPEFTRLKVASQIDQQWQLCFGVGRTQPKELLSILNKAIATIPSEEMQSFIYNHTVYRQQITLWSFIRSHPLETITVISVFLLFIVVLLLIWVRQRIRDNRKMALDLKKHLQLYGMVNDYFIEYDFEANTLMVTSPPREGEETGRISTYDCDEFGQESIAQFLDFVRCHEEGVVELKQVWLDGMTHWLRMAVKRVNDDEGRQAYAIGKITLIDEEKREQELLMEQAQQDGLTEVLNARAARLHIEQYLAELDERQTGALILLDIDAFKSINDTFGHMQGDYILKEVAAVLEGNFRTDDVVGRPGGDEFIVYMRNFKDLHNLEEKCEAVCDKIRRIQVGEGRYASVSMGVALAAPGMDYETLYQRADHALYTAKRNGRNRYIIARDNMLDPPLVR